MSRPLWAAYCALRSGRLVALDKCPGVRPIGIGESFMCPSSKCVLFVAGGESKESCGVDQLSAGLEAGIKGAIHATGLLCETHLAEEEWGFLIVDARNAFNEGNGLSWYGQSNSSGRPAQGLFLTVTAIGRSS
jgi:hypothetical protein